MSASRQVGIGLRQSLAMPILKNTLNPPDFIEITAENWMYMGGYWKHMLDELAEKFKFTAHGLSLSIGSEAPLDMDFLKDLKRFLDQYQIDIFSEHLSFSQTSNAHLFELLPLPFTQSAVKHISEKIRIAQDVLERQIAFENVAYYSLVDNELSEHAFISDIVHKSNCKLLLDISNVYINSQNHHYDKQRFIDNLPLDQVTYVHMGGFAALNDDILIDTHSNDLDKEVLDFYHQVIERVGSEVPVLLERDDNFDEPAHLFSEMESLRSSVKV